MFPMALPNGAAQLDPAGRARRRFSRARADCPRAQVAPTPRRRCWHTAMNEQTYFRFVVAAGYRLSSCTGSRAVLLRLDRQGAGTTPKHIAYRRSAIMNPVGSAGELLRKARKQAGLSQAELAQRAGVTQSVVSAYESGARQPSLPTLARLVEATGLALG